MQCPRYPRKTPAVVAVILILGILLAPLAADAQQAGKVWRIGWLTLGPPPPTQSLFQDVFLRELLRLGYIERQNFVLETRYADGKDERLPDLAAELVRLRVDVIVALATPSALAAKHATTTIPIVIVLVTDPARRGLVASLARPGGNVTGMTYLGHEVFTKGLELLKEAAPGVSRVAAFMQATDPAQAAIYKEVEAAAKILRVSLYRIGVRNATDLDGAFAAAVRQRAQALLVYPLPVAPAHVHRIAEFAVKNRLPTMTVQGWYVETGFMASYGPNSLEQFQRAAVYVDKILKGAKPADLPVEQPTKFELVVNLKTAKALGLTIPQSILIRADETIQ